MKFPTSNIKNENSLPMPLFGILYSIGLGEHNSIHHYNTGSLFWSLARLFSSYERVMSAVHISREYQLYLEDDIENFIIRFRIVLNDIAYVVRQVLPENQRGLSGPKGAVHPKNREVSFFKLKKYLAEQSEHFPEFTQVFSMTDSWTKKLRKDRDQVIHYKAKALVFDTEPLSFALINAAGNEKQTPTLEGGSRVVTTPVEIFVNDQLVAMYEFLDEQLSLAIRNYAERKNLKTQWIGNPSIQCIGINTFRRHNGISNPQVKQKNLE